MTKILKCDPTGPCQRQDNYFNKNDRYKLTGTCCSFCDQDVSGFVEEIFDIPAEKPLIN